MVLGEKVFLFIWAIVSSTTDVLVDYTSDILQYITTTTTSQTNRKKKPQQFSVQERRRKAYFRRLRHQMGVYTPEKDKAAKLSDDKKVIDEQMNTSGDELDSIAANLQRVLVEDDKQSKLEDLESQLMEIKQQLAFLSSSKLSPQKHQLQPASVEISAVVTSKTTSSLVPPTPSMMNNHANIAASITTISSNNLSIPTPPPPPPLPMVSPAKASRFPQSRSSAPNVSGIANTRVEHSMSLADIIRSAKNHKLRPTSDVQKSPNGTPARPKVKGGGFQSELFAAIKSKFKTMNDDEDSDSRNTPSKKHCSDSDAESDGFDTPPKRMLRVTDKENISNNGKRAASPIQSRQVARPLHTINK